MALTARGPYVLGNDLHDHDIVIVAAFLNRPLTATEKWVFEEASGEFDDVIEFNDDEKEPRVLIRMRADDVATELPAAAGILERIEARAEEVYAQMRAARATAAEQIETLMSGHETIPTTASE